MFPHVSSAYPHPLLVRHRRLIHASSEAIIGAWCDPALFTSLETTELCVGVTFSIDPVATHRASITLGTPHGDTQERLPLCISCQPAGSGPAQYVVGPFGESPPIREILDRAESNFRMATDEQIARFSRGLKRKVAEPLLTSALDKMRRGAIDAITSAEHQIVVNFGDSVIWNPALRGQDVFDDFKFVMMKNGLVGQADGARMDSARAVVILHAITAMHGAAFDIGDGLVGELQAGFENRDGCLEVTAALKFQGYPKQVSMKVGLFWTDLLGRDHVGRELAGRAGPWCFPIEIRDGKLEPIGSMPPLPEATDDVSTIDFPGER